MTFIWRLFLFFVVVFLGFFFNQIPTWTKSDDITRKPRLLLYAIQTGSGTRIYLANNKKVKSLFIKVSINI